MSFLRNFGKLLMGAAALLFLYDLVYEWMINAVFNIRNLREFISDIDAEVYTQIKLFFLGILSPSVWDAVAEAPAPITFFVIGLVIYLIYRLIFLMQGGKTAGGYIYKSHD
jgi:hypothetical protein